MAPDQVNRTDRDQLLSSLIRQLEADDRVRAAWLAGSLGRGDADDLSDIDLWLAVSDDLVAEVVANPVAWVRARCDADLAFSIPRNAAAGGAYVFSLVRCPHGLQQVDWYWAPAKSAERPKATAVLFERDPAPIAKELPGLDDWERQELTAFWCRESLGMAHISTKGIRRGDPWVAARHLQLVADCVGNARWVHEHRRAAAYDDLKDAALPDTLPASGSDQFRLLLDLVTRLDEVFSSIPDPDRAELLRTREAIRNAISQILDPNADWEGDA